MKSNEGLLKLKVRALARFIYVFLYFQHFNCNQPISHVYNRKGAMPHAFQEVIKGAHISRPIIGHYAKQMKCGFGQEFSTCRLAKRWARILY